MAKQKAKHGGKREGAGRKPKVNPRQQVTFRLSPEIIKQIKQKAEEAEVPSSRIVEEILGKGLSS